MRFESSVLQSFEKKDTQEMFLMYIFATAVVPTSFLRRLSQLTDHLCRHAAARPCNKCTDKVRPVAHSIIRHVSICVKSRAL